MRLRFAPSPTGYLHVGSARTALFNWLAVRHAGGEFVLRSDDTDQERGSDEYYHDVIDGLRWLGLDWDEGIEVGGPHGSYKQSDRLERYQEVAGRLLGEAAAYLCFCTPAELDERRKQAQKEGRPPGYDGRCRTLDPADALSRRDKGEAAVVRLSVPRPGETVFHDVVRGEVRFGHDHVEDFVLLRSNGSPTYHLASTVDDVDYEITHVVRGEDLLSSTPKHILITTAMGATPPIYAHLSLLMGPDGKKLSKRHGDTALHAYRTGGFLPEAFVNYVALLGWNFGDDETVFTREEMVSRFDLSDIQKNPAVFDNEKLSWMNGVYIRDLELDDFVARTEVLVADDLGRSLTDEERATYAAVAPLIQERMKVLTEAPEQVRFLFTDEIEHDEGSWQKVLAKPDSAGAIAAAIERLADLEDWSTGAIESALRSMLEDLELNARKGLQPLRVAVTGSSISPPLFESLEALGRDRTLARLGEVHARL
ncbi:MAG: glutamate--tRNA ligase [Acidimicrobiia bacterium]|nr:glutamate--tRNA ligase [Acidimicrobiia bacterium]MBT8191935.1 glutamate--tRNA ligase [Acidimicrobiia bacterium]NNF87572.1 glutamate--tRNA ligase [Acidimicrobiia bacterium]NNL13939.1 glutamate--tRNA ligase [Acidimicrobiia bacterium]NNL96572.1 glutamate--tRNA ligase [Acidimicrobiia bacterium]